MTHPAGLTDEELLASLEFERFRGPGPGGQHRNKVETFVRVTHGPTGIRAQAGERRSLAQNRHKAVQRLRLKLAMHHRQPLTCSEDDTFVPSTLWKSRLEGRRVVVSAKHEDYPPLLAEALDVVVHCDDDVARAARMLGTSTAQLVRFLGKTPAVLAEVNARRQQHGRSTYR